MPAPSLKNLKGAVSVLALSAALGLAVPAMAQQH